MKLLVAAALVLVLQSADGAARPKGLLTKHVRNGVLSLVQPLIRPTVTVPGVPDGYTDESSADFVPSLPGYGALDGKLDFGLYAGYMTVNEEAGRALYYTFAESKTDAAKHPLVLWLNGGPGCSSIGGGFLSELGPIYPTNSKKVISNPHAWNKDANVIFVDSPANVGFSYSNDTADLFVGDYRTASDLVHFLKGFYKRFPGYKGREFWISGESYGGHYVPNLAAALLDAKDDEALTGLNLQGFLVGNAWTDPKIDNNGTVDFWWYHGLISDETYSGIKEHCNMGDVGPLYRPQSTAATAANTKPYFLQGNGPAADARNNVGVSATCQSLLDRVPLDMGPINIYDVYAATCLSNSTAAAAADRFAAVTAGSAASVAASMLSGASNGMDRDEYDPCIDNEVAVYLNRQDVQEALHVPLPARPTVTYEVCSNQLVYNRSDVFVSMLPKYEKLVKANLKMLVFSGDIDGIVPLVGTRRWIDGLGLDTKEGWRPYFSTTGQVAGRVVVYDGLTFATVRAAGHMVPYVQPERAAYLFRHWIHQQPL